jgi:FtsP/CotA-like multicopper oxidase with cupredoxin domain
MSMDRRHFLSGGAAALVGAGAVGRGALAALPELVSSAGAGTQPPRHPVDGPAYRPVVTLNGWTLPWRMRDGWKEFHLVAEPVVREIAPGMTAKLWGYNGQSPGPTLECVEGDRVRVFVTNRLPEHTSIHWHGILLPNGMDGVSGLTQPPIQPGRTMVYEFTMRRSGTFMYHPHADEMVQMAMGMMGAIVVHPRDPALHAADRDYVFLVNAYDVEPGSRTPRVATMLDFNLWTWNSRAFPGIDHLVCSTGERLRIRVGNLTMTNHPLHLHGTTLEVVGTDGGWVPPAARWPEVTVDLPVGAMRVLECVFEDPGDWSFHCHKSHHTMGPMGHRVPTMIGVDQRGLWQKFRKLAPGYMVMGDAGMAEMAEMQMELPENTLPMMTGEGPFGPIEMGGMFTVVKVREGLQRDVWQVPDWYAHPPGSVAREWEGEPPAQVRVPDHAGGEDALEVVRPGPRGHGGDH